MNLLDRVQNVFAPQALKARLTQEIVDGASRIGASKGARSWTFVEPRKGSKILRRFADNNEFVRTAINRRKRQIGQADWRLVRRDDRNAPVDKGVLARVTELLDVCNDDGDSIESVLDRIIEDVLVLDAGCIEKEKTLGGDLVHLYWVDGSSIAPDPEWSGVRPRSIRYRQYDSKGKCVAEMRNDQLVYMMMNPSTHRVVGWSPLETLFRVVRAELYGEEYDYEMMLDAAPGIAIYLGAGISDQQRERYAEYWEAEISGQKNIAFLNSPDPDTKVGPQAVKLRNDTFGDRLEYKKWLAIKIASVFEMDLTAFNLTAQIQKSLGNTLTARTDEGANGLAKGIARYITRQIVWEIDPLRRHAFEFEDLNQRDALAQAKIDDINIRNGSSLINEVRADRGKPPVEYGNEPRDFGPTPGGPSADDGNAPNDSSQEPDESNEQKGGAKSAVPFAGAPRMRTAGLRYLAG